MKKLVIIRGNSGSGKSTVAKCLREGVKHNKKIAIIEQDYLRRFILKEKEADSTNNIDLIKLTVLFAFEKGYDVLLEGILYSKRYKRMIEELMDESSKSYIYYLDISFDETLRRHKTKYNADEFGKSEMRSWYKKKDILNFSGERVLGEELSKKQIVEIINSEVGF
ncbi:MAG: zeta toxin family protein [Patescibacteria group bacterium]|nr:zeta toxin family protein [Patescibacteria group bacterium]